MKALSVDVYRANRCDCTNGGISSKYDRLYVLCEDGNYTIPDDDPPENLARVNKRHLFGQDVYSIEPVVAPDGVGWMMGGNYAGTSDSRFSRMVGGLNVAIPIHDRQESQELYDALSR